MTDWRVKASPIEEIRKSVFYCIVKVGVRSDNIPKDEESDLLITHIISNYGNHTLSEIKLAFDMAITGKFEFNKNESINCFENFSCLYFSMIMNKYRDWASQVIKYQQQVAKEMPMLPAPPMNDDEIIENAYGVWKYTKRFEFISESSYDALVRKGKINYSVEQKKQFMSAAIPTLVDMEARDKNAFNTGNRLDFQKLFAKKLAVRMYFQSLPNE